MLCVIQSAGGLQEVQRLWQGCFRGVDNHLVALMLCIEDLSRANESIHRIQDSVQV